MPVTVVIRQITAELCKVFDPERFALGKRFHFFRAIDLKTIDNVDCWSELCTPKLIYPPITRATTNLIAVGTPACRRVFAATAIANLAGPGVRKYVDVMQHLARLLSLPALCFALNVCSI